MGSPIFLNPAIQSHGPTKEQVDSDRKSIWEKAFPDAPKYKDTAGGPEQAPKRLANLKQGFPLGKQAGKVALVSKANKRGTPKYLDINPSQDSLRITGKRISKNDYEK